MTAKKIFSRYQLERPQGLSFVGTRSLAKQSFKDEADVNTLVKRYVRSGSFYSAIGTRQAQFGDFSSGEEYRDVQNRLVHAREMFDELPSDIRKKFDNDPSSLLDFLANPDNADAAVEMGILPPREQSLLDVTVPTDSKEEKPSSSDEQERGTGD